MQLRVPSAALSKGNPGILHQYADGLVAFEYTRATHRQPHTLIFIGGLGDGLCTVEYVADLVAALASTEWSIFAPIISSSYHGWGTSGLGKDIDEIAQCVQYVREYKDPLYGCGKVILMGHSTGSQGVMHYLSCENPRPRHPVLDKSLMAPGAGYTGIMRQAVDGAIMQAPVSDREAILWEVQAGTEHDSPETMWKVYRKAVAEAMRNTYEDEGSDDGSQRIKHDTMVPLSVTAKIGYPATTPISSRRFLSLVSPDSPQIPEEDDMFSSDLSDEHLRKTFGMVRAQGLLSFNSSLMVLYSGRDQSVPPWVDKDALLQRWRTALGQECWHPASMIIPGASHALSDDDQGEPRRILVERVIIFVRDVERQV